MLRSTIVAWMGSQQGFAVRECLWAEASAVEFQLVERKLRFVEARIRVSKSRQMF